MKICFWQALFSFVVVNISLCRHLSILYMGKFWFGFVQPEIGITSALIVYLFIVLLTWLCESRARGLEGC